MNKHVFVFSLIIAFFSAGVSAELLLKNQNGFATIEESKGAYILREFSIDKDGWQSLNSTQYFTSLKEAKNFAKQLEFRASKSLELPAPSPDREITTLWSPRNEWSLEWERRYSEWVQQEVDEEFFVRYEISTDCADVAYILRWIFARNNGLPAANRLAGSQRVFSSLDIPSRFSRYPTAPEWHNDRRFRAALNYLANNTYTHTLMSDSYPVALNHDGISPGSYYLTKSGNTGHAQFLFRRAESDAELPFMMISSTVPREIRKLTKHFLWSAIPERNKGAMMRIKWASGRRVLSSSASPIYSEEQFQLELNDSFDFPRILIERLDPDFSFENAILANIRDLSNMLDDRKRVVVEGYDYCVTQGRSCTRGTQGWEDWSTPSRDKRIREYIESLSLIFSACREGCRPSLSAYTRERSWAYDEENNVTLDFVFQLFSAELPSHDPNSTPARRWAIEAQAFGEQLSTKIDSLIDERQTALNKDRKTTQLRAGLMSVLALPGSYESSAPKHWASQLDAILTKETFQVPRRGEIDFFELRQEQFAWSDIEDHSNDKRWGVWNTVKQSPKVIHSPRNLGATATKIAERKSWNSILLRSLENEEEQLIEALAISPSLEHLLMITGESELSFGGLNDPDEDRVQLSFPVNEKTEARFFGEWFFVVSNRETKNAKLCYVVPAEETKATAECTALELSTPTELRALNWSQERVVLMNSTRMELVVLEQGSGALERMPLREGEEYISSVFPIASNSRVFMSNDGRVIDLDAGQLRKLTLEGRSVSQLRHLDANTYVATQNLSTTEVAQSLVNAIADASGVRLEKLRALPGSSLVFAEPGFLVTYGENISFIDLENSRQRSLPSNTMSVVPVSEKLFAMNDYAQGKVLFFSRDRWNIVNEVRRQFVSSPLTLGGPVVLYAPTGRSQTSNLSSQLVCLDPDTGEVSERHARLFSLWFLASLFPELDTDWASFAVPPSGSMNMSDDKFFVRMGCD